MIRQIVCFALLLHIAQCQKVGNCKACAPSQTCTLASLAKDGQQCSCVGLVMASCGVGVDAAVETYRDVICNSESACRSDAGVPFQVRCSSTAPWSCPFSTTLRTSRTAPVSQSYGGRRAAPAIAISVAAAILMTLVLVRRA